MASHLRTSLCTVHTFSRYVTRRLHKSTAAFAAAEPKPAQTASETNNSDGNSKVYSPKLEQIFQSISQLNLLEVAELSSLLKQRLNLPDAPVMAVGAIPQKAANVEEDEGTENITTHQSFTVKLVSYDEKQKVALIKELKTLLPDMNLVQAKKFIESAPVVVQANLGKDEAEKLKESLTKVGGEVALE